MPLETGSRLGHYEILSMLGKGGMGEVYRARDTKLGRDVALKVLPPLFTHDAERMARFQREAQLLASLNHPNVASIYGLEDSGDHRAIVMELVDGPTLAGPLGLDETLRLARQVAEALEYAHERGIIHRDLKPANIKITSDGSVKVLDFGLAKALDDAGTASNPDLRGSMSPTMTLGATQAGVILGTAAYMSPEQAKGKPADRRADVWAFGVVLYEILTGQRMFEGETVAETLASVMKEQVRFDSLPAETPPSVRKLVSRCLERDLRRRIQSMGEARIMIEDIIAGVADPAPVAATESAAATPSSHKPKTPWLPWAIAGLAAIGVGLAIWAPWRTPPLPGVERFEILPPDKTSFDNALFLSPDGRQLGFTSSGDGRAIYVRSLDTLEARRIATWTQNPSPFWSPDNRFIAYQENGKLKKVDITGGPPITLADAAQAFAGGTWNTEHVIVVGNRAGPLTQVSDAGGVPVQLTKLDEQSGDASHGFPSFLPDQKHFIYLRRTNKPERTGIYLGEVGVAPEKQSSKLIIATENSAVYTPAPDPREATRGLGFLLYLREQTLMAQPFDAAKLELKGEPVPIAQQVSSTAYGFGRFTASSNGALMYATGGGGTGTPSFMTWFDRDGKNLGTIGQPGRYLSLSLSPDGKRVAAEKLDGNGSDLWLIDSEPGGKSDRFTFDPAMDSSPVWSPDGKEIVFSRRTSGYTLFRKPSNLSGAEKVLLKRSQATAVTDWSRVGNLMSLIEVEKGGDLWTLRLDEKGAEPKLEEFLKTDTNEGYGRISPDGRWLAYSSQATGRAEVYVRPFPVSPDRTGQQMVSNGGGNLALWRKDGRELYYMGPNRSVMMVSVTPGPVLMFGQPKVLFQAPQAATTGSLPSYVWDVNTEGSKFLINVVGTESAGPQLPHTLVLNWMSGLK